MGVRERRATRAWNKANNDLDAYIASQGDKPVEGTTRHLYLQAAVDDAYDQIPNRYRDPRDAEDAH
jgi:hypothetical protein